MLTAEQPQLKSSLLVGTAFVAWQQLAYLRVREDELRSIRASLIVYLSKEGWPWSCLFKVKLYIHTIQTIWDWFSDVCEMFGRTT